MSKALAQLLGCLDLRTPFNFVCTRTSSAAIPAARSSQPQSGVCRIIFDGNIQSLVLDFAFIEKRRARFRFVPQAIIEALRKVYDAKDLADELTEPKETLTTASSAPGKARPNPAGWPVRGVESNEVHSSSVNRCRFGPGRKYS